MVEIRLEGAVKCYGPIRAADGLDLVVNDGEYLCLLGPTGAGKTTSLRIISGLIDLDRGRVLFDGEDVTLLPPEDRKAVLLSQTYSLFPHMTVAENVLFAPTLKEWSDEDKGKMLNSMLDLVRLSKRASAYPHELSGGMQQRTALARALASGANILLLDEPLRALDARLRISLRKELRSLSKTLGLTTVHVTHDQEEALVMADRIAIIRDGRIVQIGTPQEVFDDPVSPFVANFVGKSNFFEGELFEREGRAWVRTDDGIEVPGRATDLGVGTRAVLGIKVGHTRLMREGGFLRGVIERMLFEGIQLHVDVDVPRIGRCSAKLPNRKVNDYQVGDTVGLEWAPDQAVIFPYPERGLEEELRVE